MAVENAVVDGAQLAGDYQIDVTHSRIGFSARHAMVTKVRGTFTDFAGEAHIDDHPSASWVRLTIRAASFTTGVDQRDSHVKGPDFLDVEQFPEITFVSTAVELVADDIYRVTGDLSIRGSAHPVTVDFHATGVATDPYDLVRAGFEGSTTINRRDWGITFNAKLAAGGVLVSDKVGLEFDVSAVRKA